MSKFEFIKTERILVESIQDECYQLASSLLHIPIQVGSKQVLGKDAILSIARSKNPNKTLITGLEELINAILASFLQSIVSKQFPGYTLKPFVGRNIIKIIPTQDIEAIQGEMDSFPITHSKEYVFRIDLNIVYRSATPNSVVDTLFHELIHFCQKMLAPIQTTDPKTPPHIKFADKAYEPQNLYSDWMDKGAASTALAKYENKPDEIEANLYHVLYRVLSRRNRRKGFSVIDRLCKIPPFVIAVMKLLEQSTNHNYTHDTLLVLITDYIMKEEMVKVAYNTLSDFDSEPAEAFLNQPAKRKLPTPASADVKKTKFYRNVVNNFVYANLNPILTQIKLNLGNRVPGLAEFIG